MFDLSELNFILNKKKSFKGKISLLNDFLFNNNIEFQVYFFSKNFIKKFEVNNLFYSEKINFQKVFNKFPHKIINQKVIDYLNVFEKSNFQKGGVISALFYKKKPVGFFYLFSNNAKENLFSYSQHISFYFDSFFKEFNLKLKLKNRTTSFQKIMLEIESIFNITELLNSNVDNLSELHQNILLYIISTLNASKGILLIKDINSGTYEIKASIGIKENSLNKKMIRDSKGILNDLKTDNKSKIINNIKDYALSDFSELNCLASPIISQKKIHGSIIIYDKESRDGLVLFNDSDLRLFDNISKKISLSFDNILLLDSLKESKKSIDNIMSSISTGIIKINILGEIEYINSSAKKVFSFNSESVIGNHYYMVFEKNNNLIRLIENTEQKKEVLFESNFDIVDFNDSKHQINLTISPVFDDDNEGSGVVLSFEDLSGINKVKSTFKKYVSENIVDELLKNETLLELGGSEKEVCVLFADIRGFTSLSEKMEASKVVYILNNYFQAMIDVIFKHNGTLDKIIGDELMVLYGVPLKSDNDSQNAVNSAFEMLKELSVFNKKMSNKGFPELGIGIGINYGKVVSGNIGSDQQMNYTVIGDNVNLASRLCSVARAGEIIISDSVYENLKNEEAFKSCKPIILKGKSKPIKNWSFNNNKT